MITIQDGKNDDNILYYICIYLGGYRGILLLAKAEGFCMLSCKVVYPKALLLLIDPQLCLEKSQ
jgi:hypothetical protein